MKVASEVKLFCKENIGTFATWHVTENDKRAKSFWPLLDESNWFISQQFGNTLGEKLDFAYTSLIEKYKRVIFLAADSPMITKEIIEKAVLDLNKFDFVINPSIDGGFYLFGGRKCISSDVWLNTTYSSQNTFRELAGKIPIDFKTSFGEMLPDVDRVEDIEHHIKMLTSKESLNIFEQRLLNFFNNLFSDKRIENNLS